MEEEDLIARSKVAAVPSEASTAPVSPDLFAVDSDGTPVPTDGSASPTLSPGKLSRSQSFSNSSSYQEDWETFPPLEKMTIFDMFDTFSLSQKIEKWQQTINLQRERVRKQRQKLKSVSDLAKDRVVDQWKKRVPTAEEQLDKYRGRMRNSVDRLNKQWNKSATVTLREKVSFLCGVMNIFISGYIVGAHPEYFYWWYTLQLFYFMPIRMYSYHKRGYHYFLADLCYFVNLLAMLSIWVFPQSKRLLIGTICLAYGNNAVAIALWRNSLVFHSHDKVVSVFIHIMPPVAFHCITHMTSPEMLKERFPAVYNVKFSEPGAPEHFTLPAMMLWASIPYAIWQLTYHRFITVRRAEKIAAGRPTSYTWLRRSYAKTWIGKIILGLPDMLQAPGFMLVQYLYALLTMIPCPLWFWYRWASAIFVTVMFMWSIHNGAAFYIDVFGKRFERELEALKRDVARWQSSPDFATSPLLTPEPADDGGSMLSDLLDMPPVLAERAKLEHIPSLDALTNTSGSQPGAPDVASQLRNRTV